MTRLSGRGPQRADLYLGVRERVANTSSFAAPNNYTPGNLNAAQGQQNDQDTGNPNYHRYEHLHTKVDQNDRNYMKKILQDIAKIDPLKKEEIADKCLFHSVIKSHNRKRIVNGFCNHCLRYYNIYPVAVESAGQPSVEQAVAAFAIGPGSIVPIVPLLCFLPKPDPKLTPSEQFKNLANFIEENMQTINLGSVKPNTDVRENLRQMANALALHAYHIVDRNVLDTSLFLPIWTNMQAYNTLAALELCNSRVMCTFSEEKFQELIDHASCPWYRDATPIETGDGNKIHRVSLPFSALDDHSKLIISMFLPTTFEDSSCRRQCNDTYQIVSIPNVEIYDGIICMGTGAGAPFGLLENLNDDDKWPICEEGCGRTPSSILPTLVTFSRLIIASSIENGKPLVYSRCGDKNPMELSGTPGLDRGNLIQRIKFMNDC